MYTASTHRKMIAYPGINCLTVIPRLDKEYASGYDNPNYKEEYLI